MSNEMGTTTTVLTESEPRLFVAEQVRPAPGSWRAIPWEDRYPLKDCGADGGEPLSYWWIQRASDPAHEQSGYMPEADARLMAAAPDMLAVLLRIRNSYPGYIPDFIEAVDAAIAKAEGRAP